MPPTLRTDLRARTVGPASPPRQRPWMRAVPASLPLPLSSSLRRITGSRRQCRRDCGSRGEKKPSAACLPPEPPLCCWFFAERSGRPRTCLTAAGIAWGLRSPRTRCLLGEKHPEPASAAPALWSRTRMLSSDRVRVCFRVSCQVPESGGWCPRPVPYVVTAAAVAPTGLFCVATWRDGERWVGWAC